MKKVIDEFKKYKFPISTMYIHPDLWNDIVGSTKQEEKEIEKEKENKINTED